MLVIRLARTGRAKYPTYRIVAAESARAATGRFVEVLGHYNPHTKELVIKREEIAKRLSNGAQPSNTVVKLLTRENVELPAWVKLKTKAPKVVEAEAVEETPADTEVSEAEAAADADTEAVVESIIADEPEADAPVEDEVRVAGVAEAEASEAGDDAPNVNDTETAASEEAVAADAETAQDAAADAAAE